MEFCTGFFKFFFQFGNALLISPEQLAVYFIRFLIYHDHKHQRRTHILVRNFDNSRTNSFLALILYQLYQTIFYKGIMPSETGFRFSSGL